MFKVDSKFGGWDGRKRVNEGARKGLLKALATVQKHHKEKEFIRRAAGRLTGKDAVPPDPDRLTSRTGTLSKSYTTELVESSLRASYGSGLVYAPVHEYGSSSQGIKARPTLERTVDATAAKVEKIMADAIAKEFRDGK
jgi:phage gpG-like protein